MKDKRVINNRPGSLRLESLCEHDMKNQTLHCVTIDCNLYVPISKIDRVPFVAERDAMIKRCPACHVPIERDQGCAQMSCKRCRHLFCWFCMKSLDVSYTRFYQVFVEFSNVWNLYFRTTFFCVTSIKDRARICWVTQDRLSSGTDFR